MGGRLGKGFLTAGLVMTLLAAAACSGGPDMGMAQRLVAQYYAAIKAQDFDGAAQMFAETHNQPRAMWAEELKDYHKKLGDLEKYRIADTVVNTVFSGTRYIFKVKTTYSKHPATETVVLFESVSDDTLHIENVQIRSRNL
ncbi:MAG TPA: hypothetical protein ENJ19_02585 [Gammaproteobacteria bacterium]|nr:hypothetical protein [Gammaproteobacteria bacterium]